MVQGRGAAAPWELGLECSCSLRTRAGRLPMHLISGLMSMCPGTYYPYIIEVKPKVERNGRGRGWLGLCLFLCFVLYLEYKSKVLLMDSIPRPSLPVPPVGWGSQLPRTPECSGMGLTAALYPSECSGMGLTAALYPSECSGLEWQLERCYKAHNKYLSHWGAEDTKLFRDPSSRGTEHSGGHIHDYLIIFNIFNIMQYYLYVIKILIFSI